MPSQVDRKAVSEESQDTGGDSPLSSSDKTDLEIRHCTFKNTRAPETKIKKEKGNFPIKKRNWE